MSLEQMLAQALKNHADIRVAEAKLREAEALLEQSRLLVSQKVIAHYHAIQAQKLAVQSSEIQMVRLERMAELKSVSAEEVLVARQAHAAAKGKLAELEAETPLLIGRPATPSGTTGGMGGSMGGLTGGFNAGGTGFGGGSGFGGGALGFQGGMLGFQGGGALGALGGQPAGLTGNKVKFWEDGKEYVIVTDWSKSMTPQGSMADRLRKALDTPVRFEFKDRSLAAVLESIKEKLGGVSLVKLGTVDETRFKQPDTRITLQLDEQVPLGAVIQAVEDLARVRFAVREYGVLVTGSDPQHDVFPPGATTLHEFWKRPAVKEGDNKPATGNTPADKDKAKTKGP
jgi:hypothetical protein